MGQYQYAGQLFCQNIQSRRSTQRVLAQVYIEAQMRVWISVQIHWGFGEYYFGWYLHIFKKIVSPGEIHQILAVNFSSLRIGFPFEKILEDLFF